MATDKRKNLKYSVYAIRCSKNGRIYIGSTSDVQNRVHQHILELRRHEKIKVSNCGKSKTGVEWQEDFDKYGEEAFEAYLIEEDLSYEEKAERENFWILEYDAINPKKGYNTKVCKQPKYKIIKGIPPKMEGHGVTVDELLAEGGRPMTAPTEDADG